MITLQDLLKPTAIITVNGIDVTDDFEECTVTQAGHQEADTVSLTLPDTSKCYLDLADFYKEKIEVSLGYYMYQGGTQKKVVRKIFTGYTDDKGFDISKNSGTSITLSGRNLTGFLIDATDSQGYINRTIEQIVRDQLSLSSIARQRYNIPDPLNSIPYGSAQEGYGTTYEIDNNSIWDTITRLASDAGLLCRINREEEFYFGMYEASETYKFLFNFDTANDGNIITFDGNIKCPNSFFHRCQIVGHNDEGMEVVYGEAEHIPPYLKDGETVKGAIQLRTLKVANDMAIIPEMAKVQAYMRLWENQRDLLTVQLGSQYGIPYIEPEQVMEIQHCDYPIFNRTFWIRNVTHTISKSNGYRMDIFGEVPPYGWNVSEIGREVGVVF